MSLGQRIRQLRQSHGLTQSQLGGSDLSKAFISLVEKDRTRPSVETLVLLARRLETSVDSLLGQEGHLPESVAQGMLALSREAIRNRDFARASKLLDTVQFLHGSYGLDEASREAQLQVAQIELEQRQFAEAWARLQAIRPVCERAKDFWRVGRVLLLMGKVKVRQREFPEAVSLLEESLGTLKRARAGRDPVRAEALIALGTALIHMGEFTPAIRRFKESANSKIARHDPVLRGRSLWGMGLAHRKTGNYDTAREFLLKAKDAFESAEELRDLVRLLQNIGQLHYEQGHARSALRYLHRALRVMERLKMNADRASVLTEIGRIHLSLGNLEDSEHFARQALGEAKSVGDPAEVAEAQVVLARVHAAREDTPAAVKLLREAVATFKERQMKVKMAEAARELGLLLREGGARAQAADYLALALEPSEHSPEPAEWP